MFACVDSKQQVVTLCKMLVDAFTTHSTKSQGTVILHLVKITLRVNGQHVCALGCPSNVRLHLRRSTSFFGETTAAGFNYLCLHLETRVYRVQSTKDYDGNLASA